MRKIGVLALQGSVAEHLHALSQIEGIIPCEVKSRADLDKVSGLILPGGESTTIGKLMGDFGLTGLVAKRIKDGMPVWGTCAGMILLAGKIVDEDQVHLGVMDITVRRNAYGSQLDSFSVPVCIPGIAKHEIPLVFIRAPWVEKAGSEVEVLAKVNDRIVAARQNNMLVTSFHPELTEDLSFHKYFVNIKNSMIF